MSDPNSPLDVPVIERPDWPRHRADEFPMLVCVQFDETGHHALQQAFRMAKTHSRAPLHIAYILASSTAVTSATVNRHTRELEDAEKHLREFVAARMIGEELQVKLHVRFGEVVPSVLQLALDYDVELIVVGTHGRRGVSKLTHGSVAGKLVEEARCPILIATPRDFTGMTSSNVIDPPRAEPTGG